MIEQPQADNAGLAPETDVVTTGPAEPARAYAAVPAWLGNLAALGWRLIAITALVVVAGYLGTILWSVAASIAVAVIIAALFAPWTLRLTSRGWSRTKAAATVWAIGLLVIAGVLALLALAFVPYLADVVRQIDNGVNEIQAQLAARNVPDAATNLVALLVGAVRGEAAEAGSTIGSSIAGVATVMILSIFLVFFFLRDGDRAWHWVFQAFTDGKREHITEAGSDALARVGGYLRGTAVLSAIIALTDFVFMVLLGVPLAAPLAVLVFVAGFIPYFGGIVTTSIVLLVTLAAVGPGPAVAMLVLIGIRNSFLSYGLRPRIYGRSTSVHPGMVLIVLPAGYQVAGVVGLFIAVPVLAVILAVATAVVDLVKPDQHPPLPAVVPPWLDRLAQWSWRLLVAVAMLALLIWIVMSVPTVIIPIVLAMVLAATLDPLVAHLERGGRSRGRSAAIVVGGSLLAIAGALALAVVSLVPQADALLEATRIGTATASDATGGVAGALEGFVAVIASGTLSTLRVVSAQVASVLLIVILSTLLTFYLLRDGSPVWERIVRRADDSVEGEIRAAGRRAFEVLGGYMTGTAVISFVGAASQLLIMLVLGIPLAVPIFVLSFFLCFIPYIGGFISTGIAFLVTVAFGSTTDIAIMGAFTLVFNIVTGNIVSPLVYGKTVHLHPAVVLVAIPAGSAVAGILGMFFVVPAIGVVAVTWRAVVLAVAARTSVGHKPRPEPPPSEPVPIPAGLELVPE